ncbi:MAG: HEAT repeat domain-containing protein [Planctomycetota bacterium]
MFDDLVKRMLSAWGREKQRIANEVINRIASSEDKSSQAAWAGYLILQNGSANCIYDFVGILSRLGPSVIRDCVVQALQANGGTQYTTDDYWFALVRALGYLCRQGHTDEFLPLIMMMSRNPKSISIREAAVYALADIGDESANIRLKQMAEKDLSPIIREVAQESLEEVEAE